MVHNASGSGEDDVTELARRKKAGNPLLDIVNLQVEARADNANLVKTAVQEHNDLSGAVVINELEVVDVAVLLDHLQKADDNLRGRTDKNLALTGLLSVMNSLQGVS